MIKKFNPVKDNLIINKDKLTKDEAVQKLSEYANKIFPLDLNSLYSSKDISRYNSLLSDIENMLECYKIGFENELLDKELLYKALTDISIENVFSSIDEAVDVVKFLCNMNKNIMDFKLESCIGKNGDFFIRISPNLIDKDELVFKNKFIGYSYIDRNLLFNCEYYNLIILKDIIKVKADTLKNSEGGIRLK